MKDRGKRKNRDQLPFELLRESAAAGRGIDNFALRRAERDTASRQTPLHEEDRTRMSKFVGRVKGYAVKSKNVVSSKYQASKVAFNKRRGKEEEDVVELLATGSSSSSSGTVVSVVTRPNGASGSGHGHRGPRDPPKDIFEDI